MSMRIAIFATVLACATPPAASRYSREQAAAAPSSSDVAIGDFALVRVVDGDTVRVTGLDASIRLLGIDTEEIAHNERERRALDDAPSFDRYTADQRGTSRRPVKMATPMGEAAKQFAAQFFTAGAKVRLERDDPRQIRDRYGRYLAYVFAWKDGAWVDYDLEAVRAGMSPYFTKYGRSRRFDDAFRAAEAEARAAHRGIWSDATQHYPDYAERIAWWNARADFVAQFERDAAADDGFIDLADDDALDRMEAHRGRQVTVLSTVGNIYMGGRGPARVMLSRRRGADFPIVFFDAGVLAATRLDEWKGEFVRVEGVVTEYRGKPEIKVDRAEQVVRSPVDATASDTDR
jgi:endonuclease YncB( thermonuclease family)